MNASDLAIQVNAYKPLVEQLAYYVIQRVPSSVEVDDIKQAGFIGLIDAIRRYDNREDVKFESFAAHRIKGAMLDELRSNDWLSRGDRKSGKVITAAIQRLEHALGVAPRASQVASELSMTLDEYYAAAQRSNIALCYIEDVTHGCDDDDAEARYDLQVMTELIDAEEPVHQLIKQEEYARLAEAIDKLPAKEAEVFQWRHEDMSYEEIARKLGVSTSRVSQLYTAAVTRLQQHVARASYQPASTVIAPSQAQLDAEYQAWLSANVVGNSIN